MTRQVGSCNAPWNLAHASAHNTRDVEGCCPSCWSWTCTSHLIASRQSVVPVVVVVVAGAEEEEQLEQRSLEPVGVSMPRTQEGAQESLRRP